ncbi:MAG TPA: hypothetical protein VF017_19840 [Thermoanaerobaculia bacterium]|nr:hypothetical protein [Thermoanaerobaculia bacterium]
MPSRQFGQPRVDAASSRLASLVMLAGLGILAACSSTRGPAAGPVLPPPQIPPPEAAFFLDPSVDYPRASDPRRLEQVRDAFSAWVLRGEEQVARREAQELLAVDPTFAPARLLGAQLALSGGATVEALATSQELVASLPPWAPAQLLFARASDLAGELVDAFEAYRRLGEAHEVAARRADEILPRVAEIYRHRVAEALRLDQLEEARRLSRHLLEIAPSEQLAWEAAREVAALGADPKAELAAVTWLSIRRPEDEDLLLRRGDLELEVGKPERSIEIYETLLGRHPGDPRYEDRLDRAKFRWRMIVLPAPVRSFTRATTLSRSGLAVLLYWLVPEIRSARPQSALIASDVVGHPHREEIARVINLGLMAVDPHLHRFAPDSPASRREALRALLTLAANRPSGCENGATANDDPCARAEACGWLDDLALCGSREPLSGDEAVELIRRSLVTP